MLFLLAILLATPPDFSRTPNLTVLAPGGGMAENTMALSGTRAVIAVMKRDAPRAIGIFVSNDSGLSWSSAPDRETSIAGKSYAYAWDPWLAVLDDGSFGLTYMLTTDGPPSLGDMVIVYEHSSDGVTWSAPVVIDSTPLPNRIDKPTLAADRAHGVVYLSWTRYTPIAGENNSYLSNNVLAASHDRGATWSEARSADDRARDGFPQMAVTADGTIIYTTADPGQNAYLSRVSTDGGVTFSAPQAIGKGGLSFFLPANPSTFAFASWMQNVVAFRGDVYCVYPVWEGVFYTRSRDGGQTWSTPLHVAGRIGGAARPSIAVDERSGSIIVSWIDSVDDPKGATYRLYAAQSDDGGATFSTPVAFSPPFPAGADIGDFDGSVVIRKGLGLAAFSPGGGYLTVARVELAPAPPRRRAAGH